MPTTECQQSIRFPRCVARYSPHAFLAAWPERNSQFDWSISEARFKALLTNNAGFGGSGVLVQQLDGLVT